jgi:hypothetical protein
MTIVIQKNLSLYKIPEEHSVIYEIYENYPQIYKTYYKALEIMTLELDRHKEREIPEVNWIYRSPGSEKTKLAQDSLKS